VHNRSDLFGLFGCDFHWRGRRTLLAGYPADSGLDGALIVAPRSSWAASRSMRATPCTPHLGGRSSRQPHPGAAVCVRGNPVALRRNCFTNPGLDI
jgi:hypothetical protein